jgi:hypothetical protein
MSAAIQENTEEQWKPVRGLLKEALLGRGIPRMESLEILLLTSSENTSRHILCIGIISGIFVVLVGIENWRLGCRYHWKIHARVVIQMGLITGILTGLDKIDANKYALKIPKRRVSNILL